jgi:hypothetical protein
VVERTTAEAQFQSGLAQLRVQKLAGDEKVRWTYEARQEVHGYFDVANERPQGKVGKGLLVISGTHARLSNISANGTWLRDEKFEHNGRLVVRTAGQKVGRVLEAARAVREKHPEIVAELDDIMSQPGATVDGVLQSWIIEAQAQKYL